MKDWDREHLEKWKETQVSLRFVRVRTVRTPVISQTLTRMVVQRRHLQMERNDLRLELTLEKRREIFQERNTNESRLDASQGVVEFEKNMTRLGLEQGSADQEELRAVSADDEGAVAHFYRLERRVEELDFRPSSNIKMMKELKRRRKAQLATEKDRRIRKQRAAAEQKVAVVGVCCWALHSVAHHSSLSPCLLQNCEYLEADSSTAQASVDGVSPESVGGLSPGEAATCDQDGNVGYLTELYLQGKLSELEVNYTKLRESGQQKRDLDMAVLQQIRNKYAEKSAQFRQRVCSDVVDRLVSLAYVVASTGYASALWALSA